MYRKKPPMAERVMVLLAIVAVVWFVGKFLIFLAFV